MRNCAEQVWVLDSGRIQKLLWCKRCSDTEKRLSRTIYLTKTTPNTELHEPLGIYWNPHLSSVGSKPVLIVQNPGYPVLKWRTSTGEMHKCSFHTFWPSWRLQLAVSNSRSSVSCHHSLFTEDQEGSQITTNTECVELQIPAQKQTFSSLLDLLTSLKVSDSLM